MKVLFVASEVAPFAKTGGLADVAGALPAALEQLGLDVRVAMPHYGSISHSVTNPLPVIPYMDVQIGDKMHQASVFAGTLPGSPVPVYFIHNPEMFHRDGLYQEAGKDYPDNARRFAFFCKSVLWLIKGLNWIPDVIHCNDWQTALLPVMLKTEPGIRDDPDLQKIKTVYTVHNLAYQGLFPFQTGADIGLSSNLFRQQALEFYSQVNFMKGGLVFSDLLTTVSPTYAREIQTPEFGAGLDGVLRDRADDLFGILNGIDYSQWNPEVDQFIPALYSSADMAGKAQCKAELQSELELAAAPQVPLLAVISRLDPQKGLDLLLPLIPRLMAEKVQMVILGTGLPEYHAALTLAADRYVGQLAVRLKFDNGLAHRIEAGSDIFLMPSRYEPCGLNQLYSLRYGTLPVVRHTGGLADSVDQVSDDGSTGTGFVFTDYTSAALHSAIQQAVRMYGEPVKWQRAQKRAMEKDFSWTASARLYADLYRKLTLAA